MTLDQTRAIFRAKPLRELEVSRADHGQLDMLQYDRSRAGHPAPQVDLNVRANLGDMAREVTEGGERGAVAMHVDGVEAMLEVSDGVDAVEPGEREVIG